MVEDVNGIVVVHGERRSNVVWCLSGRTGTPCAPGGVQHPLSCAIQGPMTHACWTARSDGADGR
jgi:hypothetical protein